MFPSPLILFLGFPLINLRQWVPRPSRPPSMKPPSGMPDLYLRKRGPRLIMALVALFLAGAWAARRVPALARLVPALFFLALGSFYFSQGDYMEVYSGLDSYRSGVPYYR